MYFFFFLEIKILFNEINKYYYLHIIIYMLYMSKAQKNVHKLNRMFG